MSEQAFNLGTVIDDAKRVITNPAEFYRTMPTSGGYANPLIFVLVMAFVTGVLIAITSVLVSFSALVGGAMSIMMVVVFPIIALIGSFIGAGILFVIWKLMGSEQTYECAYRCVAYSMAIAPVIAILSIIPYIAGIVKTLWSCFLLYTASIETHKLTSATPKIVFGVLAAFGVLVGISSEHTARNFQNKLEQVSNDFPNGSLKRLEDIENMTPEQAGEEFGKFLKGLEGFQKGMEKAIEEDKSQ